MNFIPTNIRDVLIVESQAHVDDRGSFARAWCCREFAEHGLGDTFKQANSVYSSNRGTLRGMHYQYAPHEEVKLMRCTRGGIYDVAVDVRPQSPTYKQWIAVELTDKNNRMLYVPQGFAHGYLTLVDDTEVYYLASQFYAPDYEAGLRWNDPAIGIQWPDLGGLSLSTKDKNWPDFG